MNDHAGTSIIDLSKYRKEAKREELRRGSRLNVEYQKIEGVLHTEADDNGTWSEEIKFIMLKDISKHGFQVKTKELDIPEFIGTIVLTTPGANDEQELLDIDSQHTWSKIVGDELYLGFRYRNINDDSVQTLLNAVASFNPE